MRFQKQHRSRIALFCLFLLAFQGFSQTKPTFQWKETSSKIENETEHDVQHYFDGSKLFKLRSIYNSKIFNTDIFVDIYDSKDDFELDDTKNVSVSQPVMGLNMLTIVNTFYLSGREQVQFLSEFNRESRENELFFRKVNFDTGTPTKPQLVTAFTAKNGVNSGDFFIARSENKQFYVVLKQPSYDKKVNQKIAFTLLDSKFKVIKEVEHEFPFSSKQSGDHTLYVSNSGNVVLVKNIDLPKMKPYMSLFFWNSNDTKVVEHPLNLEMDYLQINQYKITFDDASFYLNGFFSDSARFFSVKYGESSPSNGLVVGKFNAKTGAKDYFKTINTEKYKSFYLKEVLLDQGKAWVIFDQIKKNTKRLPSADPSKPLEYRYEYQFSSNGMTVVMINLADGNLDWLKNINNPEPDTVNDNGDFVSGLYFLRNQKLSIIFNRTIDLNTGAIRVPYKSRIPVLHTYDATGNLIENFDIPNAGVGGTKAHCFELDTSFAIPLSDGTYLVRSRCGSSSARYGYLKI